ncbi:LytTR family transcriptional regulator DNA-binding domain-containing protein [Kaistella yananensis]|uniref:LytTR family transcriptional regulator DNA-binding domain-containing protein n=1 Tax=Kaistella TaxID=2782231 RepID=UPI0038B24A36
MNFENILYIEGLKDYVKIYLTTEQRPVLTLMTLKKLEEELPKTISCACIDPTSSLWIRLNKLSASIDYQ